MTCVACHGPHAEWVEKHPRASKEWRALESKEKELQFGMTDLGNPTRRAEVCVACHVGNHDEGKVITHAMYAAGHPPLPNFEPATFGRLEPPHWQFGNQKSDLSRAKTTGPQPGKPGGNSTRSDRLARCPPRVAKALAQDAALASAGKQDLAAIKGPDFARFDCYACHHDLQAAEGASWRQRLRTDGSPGRPMPPEWPLVLVPLGIAATAAETAAAETDQFRRHLAALNHGFKIKPFGDAETTAKTASDFVKLDRFPARSLAACDHRRPRRRMRFSINSARSHSRKFPTIAPPADRLGLPRHL